MKRFLIKAMLLTLVTACSYTAALFAQSVQDVSGKVYQVKNEGEITGTAFLFPEFLKGEIFRHGENSIKDLPLNFDAIDQLLLFKHTDGEIRVASGQIDSVIVKDKLGEKDIKRTFKKGYPQIASFSTATYYEVLLDRDLKFLKKVNKYIVEKSDYNSASKGSEIKEKVFYFIVRNGNIAEVSKNQKSVLSVFGENTDALKQQIAVQKLNLRNEGDIIKLLIAVGSNFKK